MANETLNSIKNIFTKSEQSYAPLSYGTFLNDMYRFRKAGGLSSDDFNIFDTPSIKYFKIFFYFLNGSSDTTVYNLPGSTGLLAPTWQLREGMWLDDDYWNYTSAWSYLMMNDDKERAELLQNFVYLLSNISTYSPWYFSSVEGLGEALNRSSILSGKEFKIPEDRKKITIKCLPDAYDNRIGTLLDLYRTIAFSWQQKKEILPANLRKFDMGIYIFESPIKNLHGNVNTSNDNVIRSIFGETEFPDENSDPDKKYDSNYATIGNLSPSKYLTSYKYIEFHNCEIDQDSGNSAFSTISNVEGITPEYSIDIYFDDCYEYSYNEFLMRQLGDVIAIDSSLYGLGMDGVQSTAQKDVQAYYDELGKRSDIYKSKTFVESVASELTGTGMRFLKNTVKKITLGNIFSFSLSKFSDQIKALGQGHVWNTVSSVKSYINNASVKNNASRTKQLGKIYASVKNNDPHTKHLGNIFKAQSLGSNI